jgi:hypothetical protein
MKDGPFTAKNISRAVKWSPSPDSQAHLVYNAECLLRAPELTLNESRDYVNRITSTKWWRIRTPRKIWEIEVLARYKSSRDAVAVYNASAIALPKWARDPITILHELTHMLHTSKRTKQAWHGPEYAWLECRVIQRFEPELYEELKRAFNSYEVETKRPSFSVVRYWLL